MAHLAWAIRLSSAADTVGSTTCGGDSIEHWLISEEAWSDYGSSWMSRSKQNRRKLGVRGKIGAEWNDLSEIKGGAGLRLWNEFGRKKVWFEIEWEEEYGYSRPRIEFRLR